MDFRKLPSGPMCLRNLTVPACLVGKPGDLILMDICIGADGKIIDATEGLNDMDMRGSMVLPCFIDMHTHLDKGHI